MVKRAVTGIESIFFAGPYFMTGIFPCWETHTRRNPEAVRP